MEDKTRITLGELLSHTNEVIRRNAISILKMLQRIEQRIDKQPDNMVDLSKGRDKDKPK